MFLQLSCLACCCNQIVLGCYYLFPGQLFVVDGVPGGFGVLDGLECEASFGVEETECVIHGGWCGLAGFIATFNGEIPEFNISKGLDFSNGELTSGAQDSVCDQGMEVKVWEGDLPFEWRAWRQLGGGGGLVG